MADRVRIVRGIKTSYPPFAALALRLPERPHWDSPPRCTLVIALQVSGLMNACTSSMPFLTQSRFLLDHNISLPNAYIDHFLTTIVFMHLFIYNDVIN